MGNVGFCIMLTMIMLGNAISFALQGVWPLSFILMAIGGFTLWGAFYLANVRSASKYVTHNTGKGWEEDLFNERPDK